MLDDGHQIKEQWAAVKSAINMAEMNQQREAECWWRHQPLLVLGDVTVMSLCTPGVRNPRSYAGVELSPWADGLEISCRLSKAELTGNFN